MGKNFDGAKGYLFAIEGIVDGSQHWYGKLYSWTLNTNSRIEGWIGNISQSTQ